MNAILASILIASIQASEPPSEALRQEALWTAAHNRMVLQMDEWFDDGDFPKCIQLLRVMNAKDPKDYETMTDLGWLLGSIEREDEELAVYRRYRTDYPDDKEAPYPEANFFFLKRQYDKVIPLLEPVIPKQPHPNNYRLLAHSYEKTGKFEDSVRIWEEYLKLNPKDDAARKNMERVKGKLAEKGQPKS